MPRRRTAGFIWVPPDRTTKWIVTIKGTDVTAYVLSGTFTRSIIGEECGCNIELDNSGEDYTDSFAAGNLIQFKMDFSDGSTVQWEGIVEELKPQQNNNGFILNIKGSHYSGSLLDITVTEEYTGTLVSDILMDLVDNYLEGHTYNNVETINTTASVKWNNKPLLDCVLDLMNLGNCDCFLDNNKDFNMFVKNTKNQPDDSTGDRITMKDALIELKGLGTDSIDVRNKVIVYGEADGLPVLWTSEDSESQSSYGVKEKVITDTSIITETQAEAYADAERDQVKTPPTKGSAECLFLPNMKPGYLTYVIHPPHKIHDRYRPIKYTHKIPEENTEVFFSQERGLPQLFKERIEKDLSQETIQNPHQMLYSYNFTFDDYTNVDESASNNITVSEGKLKLTSGTTGTMISSTKTMTNDIEYVHLIIKGEVLSGTKYYVVADGSTNWQEISPDTEEEIDDVGKKLRLKVVLNSASTEIDAIALLFR